MSMGINNAALNQLAMSEKAQPLLDAVIAHIRDNVDPITEEFYKLGEGRADRWSHAPGQLELLETAKVKARESGLWNFFLPDAETGEGLSNLDYAYIAAELGKNPLASETMNCSAPDTGNMEVFLKYGTEAQKEQWLKPLLDGEIRSSYAMTEPDVASSDATNVRTRIERDGEDYVINGRKWFITNAPYERTKILIVMGKSDPDNPNRHLQQSQILVPKDTPGLTVIRPLTTLGYDDAPLGHAELLFENVRVPKENILLGEGRGFEISQGRLGPGRIHHCMRLIGCAQRALELACQRATRRETFGRMLADHQSVLEDLAKSFSEIEQARLLTLKTARRVDELGAKDARDYIAAAKITVPLMAQTVIDRCMQIHGAGGLTADYPMAEAFNYARWCRQADGPDQVHMMALGKQVIKRFSA